MPLSSLHAIELQLLMQLLPGSDILRLAQCSRTIHAAARSKFAFKYAQLELCVGQYARPAVPAPSFFGRLLSALALPFLPAAAAAACAVGSLASVPAYQAPSIMLVWAPERHDYGSVAEDEVDALLAAAERIGSVHQLHLTGPTWPVARSQWDRVFTHPSMLHLRVLQLYSEHWRRAQVSRLQCEFWSSMVGYPQLSRLLARVCSLPHLHTLLNLSDWVFPSLSLHLCSAPSLTRLSLKHDSTFPGDIPDDYIFHTLARCPKLVQLDLMCPAFHKPVFRPFLDSAVGRQLQCVTLRQLRCKPFRGQTQSECAALYRGHFEALVSLTRLELIGTRNVDIVLPFVVAAPKLRLLIVESVAEQPTTCPSAPVLADLLAVAPALHLTLRLPANHRASLADVRSDRVVIESIV